LKGTPDIRTKSSGMTSKTPTPGTDCVGVGVGAVIVRDDGRIFLARRGAGARNERGRWEFPGGAVRFGEKLKDALAREVREEFGIRIEVGELINVVDHIIESEDQHWVAPGYLCRIVAGEPAIQEPDKCSEFRWVKTEEIGGYDLTGASRKTWEGLKKPGIPGPHG